MRAYVVAVEHIATGITSVSSEAYDSLEKAQAFCLNRHGDVRQVNTFANCYVFENGAHTYRYTIHDVRVV